jgi:hypothetical protein
MSIFGSIMSKIFGDKVPSATQASAIPSLGGGAPPAAAGATPAVAQSPGAAAPAAGAAPMDAVDVADILDDIETDQELNWRQSIVDLMKLLKLDSSLGARKELAKELGYTGDMGDSAKMNVWLHKQVMTKLAQNGGKVPSDLTD